jgi:alkylation response protein AidB-like acyl-CoA dehydrogenase
VLGGRGVMADHPVDRLYRSVRALRIYEGTTEVQQLVIAGALIAEAEAESASTPGSGEA